jgi:hypothetical protein
MAVNFCTKFTPTFAVNGVTITVTGITAIPRVPVTEESVVDVAVTVTDEIGVAGAA